MKILSAAPPEVEPQQSYLLAITPPREGSQEWQGHVEMISALGDLVDTGGAPVALEMAGQGGEGVRFLARAADEAGRYMLISKLRGFYPQAVVYEVTDPDQDPALAVSGEDASAREFRLSGPVERPLRTALAEETPRQVLGLIGDLYALPPGMTALMQIILWPPPPDWGLQAEKNVYAAKKAEWGEHVLAMDQLGPGAPSLPNTLLLPFVPIMLIVAYIYLLTLTHSIMILGGAAICLILTGLIFAYWWYNARHGARPANRELAEAKTATRGFTCRIRVAVAGGTPEMRESVHRSIAASLAAYEHPAGNGFKYEPCDNAFMSSLTKEGAKPHWRVPFPILSAREVGSLWQIPDEEVEVPGMQRKLPRVLFPVDPAFRTGLAIGAASAEGYAVPVCLPEKAIDSHMVVLGATGSGKSTFFQRAAQTLIEHEGGEVQFVVIDPHGDLVRDILGWYPAGHGRKPVVVRLGDPTHKIGYNVLQPSPHRADEAIVDALSTGFARFWEGSYGYRMDELIRHAGHTLLAYNRTVPPEQYLTVLDVSPLLQIPSFRQKIVLATHDFYLYKYWRDDYGKMRDQFRMEVIKPVLTKLNRFALSPAAAGILGQRQSTIDLGQLLMEGSPIFIDANEDLIGRDTASLLDSLFINELAATVKTRFTQRRRVVFIIDEAQHARAEWKTHFRGIRKWGGSFWLATQSIAGMEEVEEGLANTILNNTAMGTKMIFSSGDAEECEVLAKSLDEDVTFRDILNLPVHTGYLKTTDGQRKLPVVSVTVTMPPQAAPGSADFLIRATNRRFGTPIETINRARRRWLRELYYMSQKEIAHSTEFLDDEINAEMADVIRNVAMEEAERDNTGHDFKIEEEPPAALPPGSIPGGTVGVTRPSRRDSSTAGEPTITGQGKTKARWSRSAKRAQKKRRDMDEDTANQPRRAAGGEGADFTIPDDNADNPVNGA